MNRRLVCLGLLVIVSTWAAAEARAAEKTAGELLPASIVAYLEVPQPAGVLDLVLDHPLARQLRGSPNTRQR